MILNPAHTLTTPQPNPDPLTWDAAAPCGRCVVEWSQTSGGQPVPAVCGCAVSVGGNVSEPTSLKGPRLNEGAGRMLVAPARPTPCQPLSPNKEQ